MAAHKCEQCVNGNHAACLGMEEVADNWPSETVCGCRCKVSAEYRRYALNHVQVYRTEEVLARPANAAIGRYVTPGEAPMSIVGEE